MVSITPDDAFLIVDVQNDFCPGGYLAVPDGDAVVPVINNIVTLFPVVIATQDWHPPGHISFARRYADKEPFTILKTEETEQMLWPDHCVIGTPGADFHPDLDQSTFRVILRKGMNLNLDSYSAFLENDHATNTGLTGLLRELGVSRIFVAGLATDYCVRATALHGRAAGFKVLLIDDACRPVDQPAGNLERAMAEMTAKGVHIIHAADIIR